MLLKKLKKTADKADASQEELEKAGKDLSDILMPIGSKLYEAGKSETPSEDQARTDEQPKTDEPIEGEVVDEEDKK